MFSSRIYPPLAASAIAGEVQGQTIFLLYALNQPFQSIAKFAQGNWLSHGNIE